MSEAGEKFADCRKNFTQKCGGLMITDGKVELLPCCDTLQVRDYSRFNMAGFHAELMNTSVPETIKGTWRGGEEPERRGQSGVSFNNGSLHSTTGVDFLSTVYYNRGKASI